MQASGQKSEDFSRKTQTCNAMFANGGVLVNKCQQQVTTSMDSFFSQLLKTITNYCDGQFSIHRLNRLNRLRWTIYVHEIIVRTE